MLYACRRCHVTIVIYATEAYFQPRRDLLIDAGLIADIAEGILFFHVDCR